MFLFLDHVDNSFLLYSGKEKGVTDAHLPTANHYNATATARHASPYAGYLLSPDSPAERERACRFSVAETLLSKSVGWLEQSNAHHAHPATFA